MPKWRQKIDASWMGILGDFFWILGASLAPKWRQVGHPKRIVVKFNCKGRTPKKYLFSDRILIILGFGWSNIGAKINQKSMKKRSQHGKASWHRFFDDFGGFGDSSGDPKWTKK